MLGWLNCEVLNQGRLQKKNNDKIDMRKLEKNIISLNHKQLS